MMASAPTSPEAVSVPDGPSDAASLQTLRLLRDAGDYLLEMRHKFGSVFTLRPLRFPLLVVVSDPTLVQTIFTGDPKVLHAGAANRVLEPASGPQSVLFLDDEDHLARRRLLLSAFGDAQLKSYVTLIADAARIELDAWPLDDVIESHPRFRSVATDVMLRVVLGTDDLDTWSTLKLDLLSIQFDASRRQARATLNELVSHAQRMRNERSHVLATLLDSRDDSGRPLTKSAVVDELLALLVAGQETTAGTLAWATERLCRHPAVQAHLRSALSDDSDERYVNAVMLEILRTRPVLQWSVRQLTTSVRLGEWLLPEGAVVAASIYLMHNDPDLYPEPGQFLPDRFLDDREPRPYTFIPFGGGVRRCLGTRLAMLEIRTVMSDLLRRFELQPAVDSEVDEGWRRSGITYVPADGALVRLQPIKC